MKGPLKQQDNKIIDQEEIVIAKVNNMEEGAELVNAYNLDYHTKGMSFHMWRVINYFKKNEEVFIGDPLLEKSVKKVENYLMKNVNYD
jgi:hypothetical protein